VALSKRIAELNRVAKEFAEDRAALRADLDANGVTYESHGRRYPSPR
jgi:hypothetical protein